MIIKNHFSFLIQLHVLFSLFNLKGAGQIQTYFPYAFWVNWKFYGHLYWMFPVEVVDPVDVDPEVVDPEVVDPDEPETVDVPVDTLYGPVVIPVTAVLLSPQNLTST